MDNSMVPDVLFEYRASGAHLSEPRLLSPLRSSALQYSPPAIGSAGGYALLGRGGALLKFLKRKGREKKPGGGKYADPPFFRLGRLGLGSFLSFLLVSVSRF